MFTITRLLISLSALVLTLAAAGCGDKASQTTTDSHGTQVTAPPDTVEAEHEHAHPSEGPHGGGLIELGDEAYHAELVHDDVGGTVTIYVLDSAAKSAVPIDAAEVTINLTHDLRGEQFKLAAAPDTNDPPGKSSRFVSSDAELAQDLDQEGAAAQLVINIDGKPYRGAVAHEHDHDEEHEEHAHE